MPEHAAPSTGPQVRLTAVTKTYGEGAEATRALRGVDLHVERGEFVVLLGASGSGKTTLLNIIGAIERPSSGEVVVDGRDVGQLDARAATEYRRTQVGLVFQFFNLIPTLTAFENVQLIGELVGRTSAAFGERALRAVGLGEKMDHFPSQLSGGEQQRVAIARALVKDPPLLLADEPTGSLDLETGRIVLGLLNDLARSAQRAVILVTHNAAIARMADRVVRMRSGQVVDDARVAGPVSATEIEW